jgi:hypothetical protein
MDFLTPNSKTRRMRSLSKRFSLSKTKIVMLREQLKHHDITINEKQSKSMQDVVDVINANFSSEVDKLIDDSASNDEEKNFLRQAWQRDAGKKHKENVAAFNEDQRKGSTSFKGNRWSAVTYRMALAVYSRSPAAYKALCQFDVLKLPSIWSVRNKCRQYVDRPGIVHEYFIKQQTR